MLLFKLKTTLFFKTMTVFVLGNFLLSLLILPSNVYAQGVLDLPLPGAMITPSAAFSPAIVTGMTIHPENPLQFDFIVDTGDDHLQGEALKKESAKLINYFMATLTVPEDEMWVNLSPYERSRIIADGLGRTEMGRDMLAQDYILKQLTASLLYPEGKVGQEFWQRVYSKAQEKFGTTAIPTDLFNKIWIIPQDATVYVNENNVFVTHSRLKVMLEQDYLAVESNQGNNKHGLGNVAKNEIKTIGGASEQIVREILLPEIEKEVNQGKNFSNLRQIYNSMILATWYKKKLKNNLLNEAYLDKNKTDGIELADKNIKEKIYEQYLAAYKMGVYNYIKEDYDAQTQEMVPRKYFSGGLERVKTVREDGLPAGWLEAQERNPDVIVSVKSSLKNTGDRAMLNLLNPRQVQRVDTQYWSYQKKETQFFLQNAKPENLTDILADFDKESTPEDTMYQVVAEDKDIIEGLKSSVIGGFDFEIGVFRIRGTKTWIFIKGSDGTPWGESLSARYQGAGFPYDIFDIMIHTHREDGLFPIPSAGDLTADLQRQLRKTKLYIRGKDGLTFYEAHRLTESEFSFFDNIERLDLLPGLERNVKIRAEAVLGPLTDNVWVVDARLREFYYSEYRPYLASGTMTVDHLPWEKILFPEVSSFNLSQQLQSDNPEERFSALHNLFHLIKLDPTLEDQILPHFYKDQDERIQIEVLYWASHNYQMASQKLTAAFQKSQFPIVRTLAIALKMEKNKFSKLMTDERLARLLPQAISLDTAERYRVRRIFVFTNSLSSTIFAAARISRSLAQKAGKPLLSVFLNHLSAEGLKTGADRHFFTEAIAAFRQRWGLSEQDTGNDKAMLAPKKQTPGGIDFNASNLNLREQGQNNDINFSLENLKNIEPATVNGILPVIISITPVTNFPLLLGLSHDENEEQLTHL